MQHLSDLFNYLLHIDTFLFAFVSNYGLWTYLALFMIIFCETGFVVTPFLPGDSLLFAAGSLAAQPQASLHIITLFTLLTVASILGNKLNYLIGKAIGPLIFRAQSSWLFNKNHLMEAQAFYEKHGGKTIIFARFIPIIRTFAPFVAGVGSMKLSLFTFYNLISALLWIGSLLTLGYFLGSIPIVKNNFTLVIYTIIILSLLPPFLTFLHRKFLVRGE